MLPANSEFGAYRVEKSLGSGAVGEVYRAVDTRLDRVVALKLIKQELADSDDYRQRLSEEAKAAAKIDSPCVVRVWEYSVHEGIPFIAMEYVAGHDLISATAEFSLEDKLAIALQIAEGIQAAHSAGLIHRDLKADNISLTPDRCPKIFDFGLAKQIEHDSVDEQGNIAGTLHYLAPEQLAGEGVSFGVDQFSFGVILYELVTGRRPFEGAYPASVIYSILHEDPDPPEEIDSGVPEWLNLFTLKLLAKKPADRFDNMAAVASYLRSCLEGESTAIDGQVASRCKNVMVIDLRNLSGDSSWDYFCEGFTEDVTSELSRRTNLIVSSQPSVSVPRDIREVFKRFRADFVVSGSLMRWQDRIRLNLLVHADEGNRLISSEKYEEYSEQLFDLLSKAARETSVILADVTGQSAIKVDEDLKADITAYDYYLKGKSYYQTNKPEDLEFALKMFQKALEIDPNYALAHSGLADVHVFQYMAYYDRTPERMEEARRQTQRALEINPRLPEGHRSLGRYFMFKGDIARAKECLLKTVELNPKYAVGYRSLGWFEYQQGNYSSALTWAKKSLQLAPTDAETLLLIGLLNIYGHMYTSAMVTLQRAIEISPDYGRAHYYLGLVYMKLGVLDQALENFSLACKYQGDPNCYVDAGFVHLIREEFDEARTAFQKSIEANFFPFVASYYLGLLERLCDNQAQAQAHFEEVLETLKDVDFSDPENVQILGYYALAQAGAGQTEKARETLSDLMSRDHLIGDVLFNISRCFAVLGDPDSAVLYLRQAFEVPPGPTEKEAALDPHFSSFADLISSKRSA